MSDTRLPLWSLLLIAVAAGCASSSDNLPTPIVDDGGVPGRVVADVVVRTDADDGSASADAILSSGGDGAVAKISVEIVSPAKGDVRPALDRFAPSVNVLVDSTNAADADTVSDVTASIFKVGGKDSMASSKLDETKLEIIPETNVAVHRFTDTPVDISGLESGTYQLVVVAKTLGGLGAQATVDFVVDAGPIIRIDSPGEDKYYRSSVTVDVTITDPLFGPVQDVTMLLGQRALTLGAPTGPNNSQYSTTIQFGSYDPPLSGEQLLTVRASNKNKTASVVRRKFVADDQGPTITSTIPKTGDLIGRVITVSAQVTDPAGVLDSSVVAVIAHGDTTFEVKLQPAPAGGTPNTYLALFDTARLPINALFPSISFRASDLPGNESSVGYLVSLDNTPPVADLDPPNAFHLIRKNNGMYECSLPFDPVGGDAVDDGRTVAQLFDVRARIEDRGNTPQAGTPDFTPIAGIDDTRVQLLVLDDTSQPLVVDSDHDAAGACDMINPLLTPTTSPKSDKDALLINMVPVPPTGIGDYRPRGVPQGAPCVMGTAVDPPDPVCFTTDLTAVIPYSTSSTPAIYTIPPVLNDRAQCVGRQFDALGSHVQDGWVCLAVQVSDKLGNTQVSRPVRVCIDRGSGRCATDPMPSCTGTLTATKPTPVVDATKPCVPWARYTAGDEYLYIQ
jgi:hypothetical protein